MIWASGDITITCPIFFRLSLSVLHWLTYAAVDNISLSVSEHPSPCFFAFPLQQFFDVQYASYLAESRSVPFFNLEMNFIDSSIVPNVKSTTFGGISYIP